MASSDTIATVGDSTSFDWSAKIIKDLNTQSAPVHKRSCLAGDGQLNSFRLVMSGYDLSSNVVSDSAGPSEYGTCGNKAAPVKEPPISAVVYYDELRI